MYNYILFCLYHSKDFRHVLKSLIHLEWKVHPFHFLYVSTVLLFVISKLVKIAKTLKSCSRTALKFVHFL
ncbi:unnamed protein product [Bacillus thuringiensis DB27]|uniref:Uncharacterized protein n=1 Tax=Bacillus thuringiensis DB27 TaxID=1431339 RepID=W8YDH0_BACTU|nr:unnamed protein product [Bacillus thuringiensis DB27]